MAIIYVKRRKDPIRISNARAQAVKDAKFGNGNTPKAEPDEFLDLGIWAGQFSEIIQIELDEVSVPRLNTSVEDTEKQQKAEEEAFRKMTKEELSKARLRMISQWKWFGWSKMTEKEAPKEAQDLMYKKILSFFKKNPNEIYLPKDMIEAFRDHFFPPKSTV